MNAPACTVPSLPDTQHARPPGALLALAALGIVFGDLGTSPLYALQEAFHPQRGVAPSPENVLGIVSLFVWSLILMVSLKYVLVLMRADNRGEGGILALMALITADRRVRRHRGVVRWCTLLAVAGAAMLYGDGVITPAISVLSAVEGLEIATPAFSPYVVPATVIILLLLFAVQPFGSGKVGAVFGPILAAWFAAIALLGGAALWSNPAIFAALNPLHGVRFFLHNGMPGFAALGAVVLCLTGGEALYADMGHFGRRPIRQAWYFVALPALVVSYLGQGALLLADPAAASRPFYSLVPAWAMYPMVALATLATIVASQALIAAVFSLTRQAAQLGFFPNVQVVQTSGGAIGQIYLPMLNWLLMAATIAVVLAFGSSEKLAAAFGLAVSATMSITTVLLAILARVCWRWSLGATAAVTGLFLLADLAFFGANTLKFADGGWLPLLLGMLACAVMGAWHMGRRQLAQERNAFQMPLDAFLDSLALSGVHRIEGCGVFLASETGGVPLVLLHQLKYNQVLHQRVILLTLTTVEVPRVAEQERVKLQQLGQGFLRVQARYGFMEEPDVPRVLALAADAGGYLADDEMQTTYYLGHHTPVLRPGRMRWSAALMRLFVFLRRNEYSATQRFGLPPNRVVELGARVEL